MPPPNASAVRPLLYDARGLPMVNELFQGTRDVNDPAFEGRWPGVSAPLVPAYRPGAEPRQWYPFPGYNITYLPRSEYAGLTAFVALRTLADACDAVRIVMEDLKNSIQGFSWDVHADEHVSQTRGTDIAEVKARLARPHPDFDFGGFLSVIMEESLVTDAVSIYRWRTRGGEPYALQPLDGATIKPIIDFHGMSPAPPNPAYQQIIIGRVESEFTRSWGTPDPFGPAGEKKDELIYARRFPRVHTPYGMSPVERIIMTLNMILRRQMHYLNFYTDGTVPDAFLRVSESWNPGQIADFQLHLDELLAGDSAARRHVRVIPGGTGTGLDNPKGHETWSYEFDEFLLRVVSWAFGISPQPIAKMMNRATSVQADVSETDTGIKPFKKWLERLFDREIEEFYGYSGLHFIFTDEKQADEKAEAEIAVEKVKSGIWTIDDVMDKEGKPKTNIPRFVLTGTGPVALSAESLGAAPGGRQAGGLPNSLATAPAATPPGLHPALAALPEAIKADLKKWRKVAMKAIRARQRPRPFVSAAIPAGLARALDEYLAHAAGEEDVHWAFAVLAKARRPLVAARRRIRHERRLRQVLMEHFERRTPEVARVLLPAFVAGLKRKADDPSDAHLDRAFEWGALARNIETPLAEAYLDGEVLAADVAGLETTFGLTDEAAVVYSKSRAAELVGMRLTEGGQLVDNPNAKWSVPQSVRDQIRNTLSRALAEGWTEKEFQQAIEGGPIWDWRSDMIARTEVAFALNRGALDSYKAAGVEKVQVLDGPGCLPDDHDDDEPGVNGEIWTLEESMEYALGHPNCRRDFVPAPAAE